MGSGLWDNMKFSFLIMETPGQFGPFPSFVAALQRIKDIGYEGVELQLTHPPSFEAEALAEVVESLRLPVVSFLSGPNYSREGLCLSSPRAEVRRRAVERLEECSRTAARFGSLLVVGLMLGSLRDEPDRAAGEARIEACLRQLARAAEQHGTTIAIEPLNLPEGGFFNSARDVLALTRRIGSTRLKPMLDTFHTHRTLEERGMTEPIQSVGRNLAHVHLCESDGGPLGSGALDFRAVFAALRSIQYAGYISLKVPTLAWDVGAESAMKFLTDVRASSR